MKIGVTSELVLAGILGFAFVGGCILAWVCSLQIAMGYIRARLD